MARISARKSLDRLPGTLLMRASLRPNPATRIPLRPNPAAMPKKKFRTPTTSASRNPMPPRRRILVPATTPPKSIPRARTAAASGNDFRRGGRGRWGRRGGRRHGRGQGGPGGRNLPPSKYASPQGDRDQRGNEGRYEHRGYQNRGQSRGNFDRHDRSDRGGYDQRGNENRRPEGSRTAGAASEEEILLPGESLAKYRGRPAAAPLASIEEDIHDVQPPATEEIAPRGGPVSPGPRRFSGGLPRWLLADAGSETAAEEGSAPETSSA